ncbi:ATP-dependent RNA helicase KNAG_0A04660 [Huiozyma naganishii CBS 8797]|uniref:ATP-dependent RNA helicase n=1 Tax=Huiozyma naganishii (strain ATCC MYA-139 / BCRC 22969 / CBS 8797 / KCTC 17520 / NBRC 10181 / NCYC 3082 / Yp74L-3) TaxID=1071383 RepID=J7RF02_HUIN7|nr:hypothetical protein KNAG_0A04660 [Kazachstania naganishii CBS 8797]CCK68138.1 hypothetical protein KNAG_0A04660 [Kazachstania naganishii CBS 8797]
MASNLSRSVAGRLAGTLLANGGVAKAGPSLANWLLRSSVRSYNRDESGYGGRGRSGYNRGGNDGGRPRYSQNRGGGYRGGYRGGGNGGRFPNRRGHGRDVEDPNAITFQKETLAKLVHLPVEENPEEVTLDKLHEDNVIDKMLHKSISRMGFPELTSVQQKTIKPILEDKENDVIARAKTGTGKTFAFLIPIFQHLINTQFDSQYMVKSVIVAPTRDLALQIEAEVRKIHDNNYGLKKFQCISLVGGTDFRRAMDKMHKLRPNIVIATPGRLIDVMEKFGKKFFGWVDFKVLDEADRLLEIGFKEDLEQISEMLNSLNGHSKDHIRTLLFSATLDEKVQGLANQIMNKPKCLFIDTVDKNEPETHEKIEQSLVVTKEFGHNIYAAIEHIKAELLEDPKNYKAILFTPTVKFTKFISRILDRELRGKLRVLEFHGQISQSRRTNLVKEFKQDRPGLLVCTDVGARGMDFPNIKEVLQIGLPSELANYIHRIGRTARSGKSGKSVIFLCKDELPFITELKHRRNIEIANVTEYTEPSNELLEDFALKIEFPEELSDSVVSMISYYRSCIKEYRLRDRQLLPSIARTYGMLLNEPDRKIPIQSSSFLEKLGFSRNPLAKQMFEISHRRRYTDEDRYNAQADGEDSSFGGDDAFDRYNRPQRRFNNDRNNYRQNSDGGNYHSNNRSNSYNRNSNRNNNPREDSYRSRRSEYNAQADE